MDRMVADFGNMEESGIVPVGTHKLKVAECFVKTSKAGDPMMVFALEHENGGQIKLYCVNTKKARWKLKETIEALTGKEQEHGPVHLECEELLNLSLMADVVKAEGDKYAQIGNVFAVSKEQEDPFDEK